MKSAFDPTRKHPSRRLRQRLPETMNQRLLAYAVMAGAGLAMAAQPAGAAVIYTPANESIPPNSTLHLDLDHNGVTDFLISNMASTTWSTWIGPSGSSVTSTFWAIMGAVGAQPGNSIRGSSSYASNLSASCCGLGTSQSSGSFTYRVWMAGMLSGLAYGAFADVTDGYLGLKFQIDGATHYGWARFDVSTSGLNTIDAALTGYAYESQADTPIHIGATVPEPGTLGLLALGFLGLGAWRRRKLKKA